MITETIHPSIVKAICKVQSGIKSVAKTERNQHGNYQFASTDAVYAELAHKMAEAGLMILSMEDEPTDIVRVEKDGKIQQWGKFAFSFVLATEEATWSDKRSRRTLFVQITGPQTFQAAQSYADKAYLRSLFKLPTGDHDLDAMPQGDTEEDQVAATSNGKAKRKSSAEGKRDGSVKMFNELQAAITKAKNSDLCQQTWMIHHAELKTMARTWFDTLCLDFVVTMKGFGVEIELDEYGWPIIDDENREAA